MEREKEIEEILTALTDKCPSKKCADCENKCLGYGFAMQVYDIGCRKIPDGAVVLTKEELVKAVEEGYIYDTTKGNKINIIEMAREIARKETAREIYLDLVAEFSPSARGSGKTNIFVQMLLLLKKICNKHGAEIPESVEVE